MKISKKSLELRKAEYLYKREVEKHAFTKEQLEVAQAQNKVSNMLIALLLQKLNSESVEISKEELSLQLEEKIKIENCEGKFILHLNK